MVVFNKWYNSVPKVVQALLEHVEKTCLYHSWTAVDHLCNTCGALVEHFGIIVGSLLENIWTIVGSLLGHLCNTFGPLLTNS
eukprot:892217-Heterocapsa_arctica.AAC.1